MDPLVCSWVRPIFARSVTIILKKVKLIACKSQHNSKAYSVEKHFNGQPVDFLTILDTFILA